jgi:hypothetical protein
VIDHAPLALGVLGLEHLPDDLGQRRRRGLDRARERVAAEGPEAHELLRRLLAGQEAHPLVVHHDERAVALHDRPPRREVERHDRDTLEVEKTRSLARLFSSSRRAPPKAASKPHFFSAWTSAWVFMMVVYFWLPWSKGFTPTASGSRFVYTSRSKPFLRQNSSRKVIMSRNFQVVSTWRSGNGSLPG